MKRHFSPSASGHRMSGLILAGLFAAAMAAAAEDAAPAGMTPGQEQILTELLQFRPPPRDICPDDDPQCNPPPGGVWMLSAWNSDSGLTGLAPAPAGAGNAGAAFRRLEELYGSEKAALESGGEDSRGVQALLEAAAVAECRLTPDYYGELVSLDAKQPDFAVMQAYLYALLRRAGAAERGGDVRDAENCYRAALRCGSHLTRDKSSSLVYMTGLIFKLRGVQGYQSFLLRQGRQELREEAGRYRGLVEVLLRAFTWKANVALSTLDDFASVPAIIRIATEDEEAFWRKEALSRLALVRHGVKAESSNVVLHSPAWERAAEEILASAAANDPDPSVRRLAVWLALNVQIAGEELEHRFVEIE